MTGQPLDPAAIMGVDELRRERMEFRETARFNFLPEWCAAMAPEGWECTRPGGHNGDHIADTSRSVLGSWPR